MNQADFFSFNRQRLFGEIDNGLVVLSAYSRLQQRTDMPYKFVQESNFWWLCGINEPDWKLVIDCRNHSTRLVMPDISSVHAIFDGALSKDEAKQISGCDEVINEVEYRKILKENEQAIYSLGKDSRSRYYNFIQNPAPLKLHRFLKKSVRDLKDIRPVLVKLRAIKSDQEIAYIREAIEITTKAFQHVRSTFSTYKTEQQIETEFSYFFGNNGASHAYEPIVAGGKNACTLHYVKNNRPLRKGQAVLLDIGALKNGYSADISRTYCPEPSERVQALHRHLKTAQQNIIELIQPGVTYEKYMEKSNDIMKRMQKEAGLLERITDNKTYRQYFPHAVSHGLGVDVHDSLGGYDAFMPGMVLTVEPGVYISEEGIGIRLEDNILVTQSGHENMSAHLSSEL